MAVLQDILYLVTSGLLIPCIAYLLFLLGKSLLAVGMQIYRARTSNAATELGSWLNSQEPSSALVDIPEVFESLRCAHVMKDIFTSSDMGYRNYLVTNYESEIDKRLGQYTNMAKLGPVLGLVGTLIPMGPALQGLADGNIQQLAAQMQIAFTTTVVGLIVGAIGFVLYRVNKREAVEEMALLDYALEKSERQKNA